MHRPGLGTALSAARYETTTCVRLLENVGFVMKGGKVYKTP